MLFAMEDKETKYGYPMMNATSDRASLLVLHSKEHLKLADVVLHVTDPFGLAILGGSHIDEINLHTLK